MPRRRRSNPKKSHAPRKGRAAQGPSHGGRSSAKKAGTFLRPTGSSTGAVAAPMAVYSAIMPEIQFSRCTHALYGEGLCMRLRTRLGVLNQSSTTPDFQVLQNLGGSVGAFAGLEPIDATFWPSYVVNIVKNFRRYRWKWFQLHYRSRSGTSLAGGDFNQFAFGFLPDGSPPTAFTADTFDQVMALPGGMVTTTWNNADGPRVNCREDQLYYLDDEPSPSVADSRLQVMGAIMAASDQKNSADNLFYGSLWITGEVEMFSLGFDSTLAPVARGARSRGVRSFDEKGQPIIIKKEVATVPPVLAVDSVSGKEATGFKDSKGEYVVVEQTTPPSGPIRGSASAAAASRPLAIAVEPLSATKPTPRKKGS